MAGENAQVDEQAQNQGQNGNEGQNAGEGQAQEQAQTSGQGTERVHGNQRNWDGEFDPERARQLVENLRNSEKAEKERVRTLTAQLKEYEDAKLTEQEKVTRDLADKTAKLSAYETRMRELSLRNEVLAEAGSLDIIDPRAAAKLLDAKAINYDPETGEPTNVREELEKLLAVSPYLKRTTGTGQQAQVEAPRTPPANPPRNGDANKPTFTEAQVRDFPFYMANKAAIIQAMAEGRIVKE
jgi:hypothetical protein